MKTPTIKFIAELKDFFLNAPMVDQGGSISSARTTKEVAHQLLLENESLIKGGHIWYFAIKHMGLNVYEIKLRPKGRVNTFIVEAFEKHLIEEAGPGCLPTARY